MSFARAALDHAFPYAGDPSAVLARAARLALAYAQESRANGGSLGTILTNVLASRSAVLSLCDGAAAASRARAETVFDRVVVIIGEAYGRDGATRAAQSIAAGTIVRPITP